MCDEPEAIEGVDWHRDVREARLLCGRQIDGIAPVVVGEVRNGEAGECQQDVIGHIVKVLQHQVLLRSE